MTTEEKLDAVFKLRLLYNSGEELLKHIGMKAGRNNSLSRKGGKDPFLKQAIFHELVYECHNKLGIDLEELLYEYEFVAHLLEKYRGITASKAWNRSISIHCEHLIEVLVFHEKKAADEPIEFWRFCDSLEKENSLQQALVLLMLLELLPRKMNTRQGDVNDMRGTYELAYGFFQNLCSRNVLYEQPPRLYLLQKALEDEDKELTRIRLIRLASGIIGNLSILASSEQVSLNGRRESWNQLWPDLEGCWLGEQHSNETPDFWEIEELSNAYLFAHYFQKNGERGTLHRQHFTVTFHENSDIYACIQHPRSIDRWLNKQKIADGDVIYKNIVMDDNEVPMQISFTPFIFDYAWFRVMKLERSAQSREELMRDAHKIIDDFEEYSYQFDLCLEAITPQFVYIEDKQLGVSHLVSVDKYGLEDCTLNDAIGIITRGNKRYLAFDNQMVYIEIGNTESSSNIYTINKQLAE